MNWLKIHQVGEDFADYYINLNNVRSIVNWIDNDGVVFVVINYVDGSENKFYGKNAIYIVNYLKSKSKPE